MVSRNSTTGSPNSASISPPLFVELFAGRAAFSKAALQSGLRVISVDHEVVQPFAPVVILDLTTDSGTRILWDTMQAPGLAAVHLGLPCGTSSRARELPIPAAMRRAGIPEPPPLRSATHPLGVPGLALHHQRRVDSANTLYKLAVEIILWCHDRKESSLASRKPGQQLVVGGTDHNCSRALRCSSSCTG